MGVVIVNKPFPPDVNGVTHRTLQTARHLAARGHEPLVIAQAAAGTTSSAVSADITHAPSLRVVVPRARMEG